MREVNGGDVIELSRGPGESRVVPVLEERKGWLDEGIGGGEGRDGTGREGREGSMRML